MCKFSSHRWQTRASVCSNSTQAWQCSHKLASVRRVRQDYPGSMGGGVSSRSHGCLPCEECAAQTGPGSWRDAHHSTPAKLGWVTQVVLGSSPVPLLLVLLLLLLLMFSVSSLFFCLSSFIASIKSALKTYLFPSELWMLCLCVCGLGVCVCVCYCCVGEVMRKMQMKCCSGFFYVVSWISVCS